MKHGRRIRHILAANVHAMLDRAEDPGRMLRALTREIDDLLIELDDAERELRTALKVGDREVSALERRIAARQADAEAALAGDDEKSARAAVERRMALEAERDALVERQATCRESLSQLADDRERLRARREDAVARSRQVTGHRAEKKVADRYRSPADACLSRSQERIDRIENRLARMEARIEAWDEVAPAQPAVAPADPAVEEALDELRQRM